MRRRKSSAKRSTVSTPRPITAPRALYLLSSILIDCHGAMKSSIRDRIASSNTELCISMHCDLHCLPHTFSYLLIVSSPHRCEGFSLPSFQRYREAETTSSSRIQKGCEGFRGSMVCAFIPGPIHQGSCYGGTNSVMKPSISLLVGAHPSIL
ncbi:hypothetical protein B9Z19DRAFT_161771 [Tuber borchii]|uniref:Uncharacterized protein n=1 Tax=Tuber borchii TaxID=42251 RepID=A0A2T7A6D7_TUBBO|nr:hypothetical protein B9Z19DRAFT_161771 [Tuber borchii]